MPNSTFTQSARFIPGLIAGGDLRTHQYKVVKAASTAGAVVVVTATTDTALGILQNNPNTGEAALVATGGIVPAIAGVNDLAVGENVGYNSTGQVADHTTDNRRSLGKALQVSTAVGDYVSINLYGGGSVRY